MHLLEPIVPAPLTKLPMRLNIIRAEPTSKRITSPWNYRRYHGTRDMRSSCTRLREGMVTNPSLHSNHGLNSSSIRLLLRKALNGPLKEQLIQPNEEDILGHQVYRHITRVVNVLKTRVQQFAGRAKPANVITQRELTLTKRDKAAKVTDPGGRVALTMRQKDQHKHIHMIERVHSNIPRWMSLKSHLRRWGKLHQHVLN